MSETFDFSIIGNSTSTLVSALELAKNGYKIALLNPTPVWGAHFGGTVVNHVKFDLGMNFLEFTSFNNDVNADLLSYNPFFKNDVGRFFYEIERYIKNRISYTETPTPAMLYEGILSKDMLISNDFEILRNLPLSVQTKIKSELEIIVARGKSNLHASNKNQDLFLKHSYKEVSLLNHGKTFHDLFIEPFCKKILNLSSQSIPAIYHRIPWAPLFYPETLYSQFTDNPQKLPETKFHYPSQGYFSSFVESLVEEANESPNITIMRDKLSRVNYTKDYHVLGENIDVISNKLIWTFDLPQFLKLSEEFVDNHQYEKASISILFTKIEANKLLKQFSTLYVADSENLIYRITNQSVCSNNFDGEQIITIEINYDLLKNIGISESLEIKDYAINKLMEMGIISSANDLKFLEVKTLLNAINAPTLNNYYNFEKLKKHADNNYTNIEFLALSAAFSASSLNDHIVQGLKIGRKYLK